MKSLRKKIEKKLKTKLKRERGWRGIRTRNLEHERPRVDRQANEPTG